MSLGAGQCVVATSQVAYPKLNLAASHLFLSESFYLNEKINNCFCNSQTEIKRKLNRKRNRKRKQKRVNLREGRGAPSPVRFTRFLLVFDLISI